MRLEFTNDHVRVPCGLIFDYIAIGLSAGNLDPPFDSVVEHYTVGLPFEAESLDIAADAGDIKTIQIYSTGTLLTVNDNVTLKLQDIILKGRPGNDTVLVKVALGGTMIINQNAKIIDNEPPRRKRRG